MNGVNDSTHADDEDTFFPPHLSSTRQLSRSKGSIKFRRGLIFAPLVKFSPHPHEKGTYPGAKFCLSTHILSVGKLGGSREKLKKNPRASLTPPPLALDWL